MNQRTIKSEQKVERTEMLYKEYKTTDDFKFEFKFRTARQIIFYIRYSGLL